MTFDIKTLYEGYLKRFKHILEQVFPLSLNKNGNICGGFNEVNQTVCFLSVAENHFGIDNALSWYELALPYNWNPNGGRHSNSERIDGVLILKGMKTILFIESKRYEGSPIDKIEESIDDALRIQQILLNNRFLSGWLKLPAGELASYTKLGLILGAIWPGVRSKKTSAKSKVYNGWLSKTLFKEIAGSYLGVNERILTNNEEVDERWRFFLPGFFWQITDDNLFPEDMKRIVTNRLSAQPMLEESLPAPEQLSGGESNQDKDVNALYQIILPFNSVLGASRLKSNTVNLRLKPACLSQTLKDHSIENDNFYIWIPFERSKIVVLCGLSSRERNSSLDMPDAWERDTRHIYDDDSYRNNYVYELGDWSDLDSIEGQNNIQSRIKGLSETLQDIRLV